MQAYQARVIQERDELLERIIELVDFMKSPIFGGLPLSESFLLRRQLSAMQTYLKILDERVAAFIVG